MFDQLMNQVCNIPRSTFYVHPEVIESVMINVLRSSSRNTIWYLKTGDSLHSKVNFNNDAMDVGSGKFSSFRGYESRHFWSMDRDMEDIPALLHVVTSPTKAVFQTASYPNGIKIKNIHLFFVPTSIGPAVPFPAPSMLDHLTLVFKKNMEAEVIKDRTGLFTGTNGIFGFKSWCWPSAEKSATIKPDDLNSILEKLYDARFRKKPHDVPALLKRYNEITGKKHPEFMC